MTCVYILSLYRWPADFLGGQYCDGTSLSLLIFVFILIHIAMLDCLHITQTVSYFIGKTCVHTTELNPDCILIHRLFNDISTCVSLLDIHDY